MLRARALGKMLLILMLSNYISTENSSTGRAHKAISEVRLAEHSFQKDISSLFQKEILKEKIYKHLIKCIPAVVIRSL